MVLQHYLKQSTVFQKRGYAGFLAAELNVHGHGVDGVAALQYVTELLGQLGIVQVAAFHKGCEGIVVEDGSPGVAVVAGIVARW